MQKLNNLINYYHKTKYPFFRFSDEVVVRMELSELIAKN